MPGLDPVILTYLNESLRTFRINCLLSSAITLGAAAEKALLVLIGSYAAALPAARQERFIKATDGQSIKRQYDELAKMLDSHLKPLLPGEVRESLEVAVSSVFNMIRTHRNEAGHPTGRVPTREEVYALIAVFPLYVKKAYELKGWLEKNPIPA